MPPQSLAQYILNSERRLREKIAGVTDWVRQFLYLRVGTNGNDVQVFCLLGTSNYPMTIMQGLTLCEISFHQQELVWTTHCTSTLHQLYLLHCEPRPLGPANVTADCCFAPSHRRSPVSARHQDSTWCVELMSDEDRCIL